MKNGVISGKFRVEKLPWNGFVHLSLSSKIGIFLCLLFDTNLQNGVGFRYPKRICNNFR